MRASASRHYGGHCKAAEEDGDKEHLEEEMSGIRNVDGGLQIQREEDGGSSTRHSWMEISGLWYASLGVTTEKKKKNLNFKVLGLLNFCVALIQPALSSLMWFADHHKRKKVHAWGSRRVSLSYREICSYKHKNDSTGPDLNQMARLWPIRRKCGRIFTRAVYHSMCT